MTPRRNQEHWQKLRKDKRSALVVMLVIVAALAAILAAIGILLGSSQNTDRSNPLYWAAFRLVGRFAGQLHALAVNTLRTAAVVATLIALASLAAAAATQPHVTPWVVAAVIAAPCATVGAYLYPRTLLAKIQN